MRTTATLLIASVLLAPSAGRAQEGSKRRFDWKEIAFQAAVIGASAFDAYTTRQANKVPGVHENDPGIRPFVRSGAVYPACAFNEVVPMIGDHLAGLALRRHREARRWVHRALVGYEGFNAFEHVRFGVRNIGLYDRPRQRELSAVPAPSPIVFNVFK